ncbi:MAG: Rieske (2Fe-2S) protein [Alphaproteobacteria bacterium]|nr:Rieske (2Fe-2S) protein [Alphaproteobacteria bacterium]
MTQAIETSWQAVATLTKLQEAGRMVVKPNGKQILLLWIDGQVQACNNRCPHEGYPLSEGDVSGCVLTCNWHNWKFDLDSGATLVGGDKLRRYPARIVDDQVELNLTDPPASVVIAQALDNITDCFDRHEYDRIARELARLMKAGGDPLDGLRRTIAATGERFEYGATHALPATSDWLSLRLETHDPVRELGMLTECIGHFAWDTRREPTFPYPTVSADWDEDSYVAAVEAEDEASACSYVRGAVSDGLTWSDLERGFARAALAHYADFGHSAIYTYKMRALTETLGDRDSLLMLCLMLTRSFVYASREDLIPEFRRYGKAIAAWDGQGSEHPSSESLRRGSVREILDRLNAGSNDPVALYDAAMAAGAWQLLHFDLAWQDKIDSSIAQNVGWLDFTHTVTFGNAVRKLAERYPELWPHGLLQMGCFLGRNSGFTDPDLDEAPWRSNDPMGAVQQALSGVEDHGKFEYIVSSHLLKLSYAIREEMQDRPESEFNALAAAALRRFLSSPLKRKHVQRTAYQALNFVQAEG